MEDKVLVNFIIQAMKMVGSCFVAAALGLMLHGIVGMIAAIGLLLIAVAFLAERDMKHDDRNAA